MAISSSIDFTVTRDDIINESLELLGVLGEGETANSDQLTSSSRTLNMMIKNWQARGLNLFSVQKNYLFIESLVEQYSLNSSTTRHFTSSFNETTLSALASSGSSTITVSSVSNISDGDNIGIASGNSVQWTTVNGAPSGSTVTLSNTLSTDSASGSTVYVYTSKANRPMKILESFVHIASSNTDIPVEVISRREYNFLSVKASQGLPNQLYYDPQITSGQLYLWPTGQDEKNYLVLFSQVTLSDLDSSSDNPEYPQEWYLPLCYNLAMLLASKYGVPNDVFNKIRAIARESLQESEEFDDELYTSVYFTNDRLGQKI